MKKDRLFVSSKIGRAIVMSTVAVLAGFNVNAQEAYFEEVALNDSTNGIVIEAEHYMGNVEATDGSGSWIEDNTFAGYNGDFYMQSPVRESGYGTAEDAYPYDGVENPVPASPYLSYIVKFNADTTIKKYYIMVRVSAADGASDSFHYGLNDNPIREGLRMDPNGAWAGDAWGEAHYDVWGWYIRSNFYGSSQRANLFVEEPGFDTLRIYMREANCRIDRIIIYDNPAWHPGFGDDDTGLIGPDETYKEVEIPTDTTDSTTTLAVSLTEKLNSLSVYPNPFTTSSTLKYSVATSGLVNIEVMNMSGQVVKRLVNQNLTQGNYEMQWNGSNDQGAKLSQGSYIIRMNNEGDLKYFRFIIQ